MSVARVFYNGRTSPPDEVCRPPLDWTIRRRDRWKRPLCARCRSSLGWIHQDGRRTGIQSCSHIRQTQDGGSHVRTFTATVLGDPHRGHGGHLLVEAGDAPESVGMWLRFAVVRESVRLQLDLIVKRSTRKVGAEGDQKC